MRLAFRGKLNEDGKRKKKKKEGRKAISKDGFLSVQNIHVSALKLMESFVCIKGVKKKKIPDILIFSIFCFVGFFFF